MIATTVILVLGVTILVVLSYRLWRSSKLQPKQPLTPNEGRLYMFYTTWCGWSKKAMPEWEKLNATLQATPVFGTTKVKPIAVDAEQDRKLADTYEVEGYPTILLETADGITHYQKRVTADGLLQFLRQTLGKERASL
jgi:thiol-disulfide isomerase/thioredoxin